MYKNKFDRTGKSFLEGKEAEENFVKYAEKYNFTVRKSSRSEDCKGHIDYFIKDKNNKEFGVDVKAMKRISRGNKNVQDEAIWIEFLNVGGNKGWIYGKSDFIAFKLTEGFILVGTKDLAALAEKLVDTKTIVNNSKDAFYKGYQRKDRPKELCSLISIDDLKTLKFVLWK